MTCPSCGTANPAGQKFCGECGVALAALCPSCGADNPPGQKFCGDCGAALAAQPQPSTAASPPQAERRLVSVLFVDLVGFTTVSESRDAEETRELLSLYFDTSRQAIERYGGTVEKFIGDAVMAIWGAPVAQEDDAERAVRAALELVAAVPALDQNLQARAGVLTGEAAVTLGAEGQGMVAGDLVNTASRVQSAAQPGEVLVGEVTRRASEAAIAYEDAGAHELKGKAEPVTLWRALRVVAARGGEGRSVGLEAPFVGRDRELRLVKDLFHATATEGRAHLLSVVGVAGIGKSRLAWEFEKYLDGLVDQAWWHRGRCLSYGESVAYRALAEMVRMRARVTEDEPAAQVLTKLHAVIEQMVADPGEREFVEPRLQHLLGLTDRTAPDKEDLFSAWRLFIERMSGQFPVVMVFEDIQWADAALIEFLEYLLEWSRAYPIFVLTLGRPELQERHPGWGAGSRSFTSLYLEPLPDAAIDALLRGLAPGLPDEVVARIRDRADGIPLYAVETVRMLLDRGLLERDGSEYRVTGEIAALDVPETLHALIAARLDGLDPEERRVLQDASVLGKTFHARGIASLAELPEDNVVSILTSLVRKEALFQQNDPRSPERGQYGFLQALVQRVAYETLARRDRKAKHLAAAEYLTGSVGLDPDEIAEVIAAHYRDALAADPAADDADAIKRSARDWLCRAGERAASLAATEDARRAFDEACEFASDGEERARLLERAGQLALTGNAPALAESRLREAKGLFEQAGMTHAAARATADLSLALWLLGRSEEALELMEPAFEILSRDEPDEDVAMLAAELGRIHLFQGNEALAMERIEFALEVAEEKELPGVLSHALNTKGLLLNRRPHEGRALIREALAIALEHDIVDATLRAYNNLSVLLWESDRLEEAHQLNEEAFELARRRGATQFAAQHGVALSIDLLDKGEWDTAFALAEDLPLEEQTAVPGHVWGCLLLSRAAAERDDADAAHRWLSHVSSEVDVSTDMQLRSLSMLKRSLLATREKRYADALADLGEQVRHLLGMGYVYFAGWPLEDAVTVAMDLGDPAAVLPIADLLEDTSPSRRGRMLEVQLARARGNAASARDDHETAAEQFASALSTARNLGRAAKLAPVLVDYARWLVQTDRVEEAQPLLDEARGLFEHMGAVVWLERIDALLPAIAGV